MPCVRSCINGYHKLMVSQRINSDKFFKARTRSHSDRVVVNIFSAPFHETVYSVSANKYKIHSS